MHSFNGGEGTKFHFNSDLSGDVIIYNKKGERIEINGYDILDFVAYYVRERRIATIEDMDTNKILGLM